jgi:NitT/TauT family transport system substrate-binding protein
MLMDRRSLLAGAAASVAAPSLLRAQAPTPVKFGIGFGVGFLPAFIADELKLFEKYGARAGMPLSASFVRFSGSAAMQDAVLSGSIECGAYGIAAMMLAWEKARNTPLQVFGVAGLTTLPLVLLTKHERIKSLADFTASDKIAMPAIVSPQMYALQMASEKLWGAGQHDRLRTNVVALPHPEALNALLSEQSEVAAYFSSAPFTQIALRKPGIRTLFTNVDVYGGKSTFLAFAAAKKTLEAQPKLAGVVVEAMAEAADLIRTDPQKAAAIYTKVEPSKSMTAADIEKLLASLSQDFGPDVHGVKQTADFMQRIGQLKNAPAKWSDAFAPALGQSRGD